MDDCLVVGSRDAVCALGRSPQPGYLSIPARHGRGGQLSGRREAGCGVVSRGRAIARFRCLQQRLIRRSDSCSPLAGMDPTECRLENCISFCGSTWLYLAGGMAPLLSRTEDSWATGCNRSSPASDPTAIKISLAVHSLQGLQRSGLVLLYFLGPAI